MVTVSFGVGKIAGVYAVQHSKIIPEVLILYLALGLSYESFDFGSEGLQSGPLGFQIAASFESSTSEI